MSMAPCPRVIVLKRGLEYVLGRGVFELPFVDGLIKRLLIDVFTHSNIRLAIDVVLPQSIGLTVVQHLLRDLISMNLWLAQPNLPRGQHGLSHLFKNSGNSARRYLAKGIPGAAHHADECHIHSH